MSQIAARLERLPFSRFHRRLLLMGGLGYCFDAMDGAVIAFVLPVVMVQWSLTSVETGVLASATFVGYFFGALAAGTAGDLIGRRAIMMWALAIYSTASFASAFVSSETPFFCLRVLAGVGIGAESVIVAPFLSEFVAKTYRGRFVGSLAGFFSFGFLGAALLGYALVPIADWGWRLAIVITSLPIALLLWWRRALPESPRWLESRGRQVEAEAILARIEEEVVRTGGQPLSEPEPTPASIPDFGGSAGKNFAALFSRPMARITAMTWALWLSITFSYYSFFTWIPTLLVQSGMTITKSFAYSIAIYAAQVPGYYSAAYFNDRIGRRATIVVYLLLGCLSAIGLAMADSNQQIVVAGVCLSLFMNGTYAGVYAYTAEVFPTRIRTTGAGVASAIGRLGAISAPILVGAIFPKLGFGGVFGVTTGVLLMGALAVLILGVRTHGRSLEAITAAELEGEGSDMDRRTRASSNSGY
jgi:MFS transporter, putative metabolite:H+ symporter